MELNYEDYRDVDQPEEELWITKEEKKVYRKGDNKQTVRGDNGKTFVLPLAKIECKHPIITFCRQGPRDREAAIPVLS